MVFQFSLESLENYKAVFSQFICGFLLWSGQTWKFQVSVKEMGTGGGESLAAKAKHLLEIVFPFGLESLEI